MTASMRLTFLLLFDTRCFCLCCIVFESINSFRFILSQRAGLFFSIYTPRVWWRNQVLHLKLLFWPFGNHQQTESSEKKTKEAR